MGSFCSCLPIEDERGDMDARPLCSRANCGMSWCIHLYTLIFTQTEAEIANGGIRQDSLTAGSVSSTLLPPSSISSSDSFRGTTSPLSVHADGLHLRREGLSRREKGSPAGLSLQGSEPLQRMREPTEATESETKQLLEQKEGSETQGVGEYTVELKSLTGSKSGFKKSESLMSLPDEDCCPTCLEAYTGENPKIMTQCGHHYHLGCIYEWMERSDACPVCNKVMAFSESH